MVLKIKTAYIKGRVFSQIRSKEKVAFFSQGKLTPYRRMHQ